MAEMARAEALVQTMEHDTAFQSAVQAARTVGAKRRLLDAHGYADVSVDDMRAYVESKGGTFVAPPADGELSDTELAAVSGGLSDGEIAGIVVGGLWVTASVSVAAAA